MESQQGTSQGGASRLLASIEAAALLPVGSCCHNSCWPFEFSLASDAVLRPFNPGLHIPPERTLHLSSCSLGHAPAHSNHAPTTRKGSSGSNEAFACIAAGGNEAAGGAPPELGIRAIGLGSYVSVSICMDYF